MIEIALIIIMGLLVIILTVLLKRNNHLVDELSKTKQELNTSTQNQVNALGMLMNETLKNNNYAQSQQIQELNQQMTQQQQNLFTSMNQINLEIEERMHKLNKMNALTSELLRKQLSESTQNSESKIDSLVRLNNDKFEVMRTLLDDKMSQLQNDNNRKLDEMRFVVDEKLQDTLEKRISKSFQLVSERLEQVYLGLGEMKTLANGVGDLKKVLSNVKSKGILGEIQCGAILEEILAPSQYECNVMTKKGSRCVVEYALKLPSDGLNPVYLPIDSKFPCEPYYRLLEAYEGNDAQVILAATKQLEAAIKSNAKDIHDKYIDVPNTTDFGIMFLPFEGLYAEVVRRGLVETLQRDYKINIAGPTTMAALLNALQMGFKTLAIQKQTSEVWEVLGSIKSEFDKFASVLENTQSKLDLAQKELDQLVGVRTRQIQKRLARVSDDDLSSMIKTDDSNKSENSTDF